MATRSFENGVIDNDQATQWYEFLDGEDAKEMSLQEAKQVIYSRENGTYYLCEIKSRSSLCASTSHALVISCNSFC